eukprot:11680584-Ditylum_brightwellii.AAC.1
MDISYETRNMPTSSVKTPENNAFPINISSPTEILDIVFVEINAPSKQSQDPDVSASGKFAN